MAIYNVIAKVELFQMMVYNVTTKSLFQMVVYNVIILECICNIIVVKKFFLLISVGMLAILTPFEFVYMTHTQIHTTYI